MPGYRPDGMVRALSTLVTVLYFVTLVGTVAALLVVLLARLVVPEDPSVTLGLPVPVVAQGMEIPVATPWGGMRLSLTTGTAELMIPFGTLPWPTFLLFWMRTAILFVPGLLAFHQLRRIFQRAREGAPFDARNAVRLRSLGLILLAWVVMEALAELATAIAIRDGVEGTAMEVSMIPEVDLTVTFVALALVALAEVFRRGAELEDEQSLVV